MSLIGVYPNVNLMTKEQLIEYTTHLESQLISIQCDLEQKVKYWEKIAKKLLKAR